MGRGRHFSPHFGRRWSAAPRAATFCEGRGRHKGGGGGDGAACCCVSTTLKHRTWLRAKVYSIPANAFQNAATAVRSLSPLVVAGEKASLLG